MSTQLATVRTLSANRSAGPVYRLIVALDLEGSTTRTNPAKGELRRVMYELLDQALAEAGISARNLERLTDRGDGVLILIRPSDDLPKTILLSRLIPILTALLVRYNATVTRCALRMRLRAVVHAGEVHDDGNGFYGEDLDVAFRLLDSPSVKRAFRQAPGSPLVLVISEEIFSVVVRQGYVDEGPYRRCVQVRVGDRRRRGRIHLLASPSRDRLSPAPEPRAVPAIAPLAIVPAIGSARRAITTACPSSAGPEGGNQGRDHLV